MWLECFGMAMFREMCSKFRAPRKHSSVSENSSQQNGTCFCQITWWEQGLVSFAHPLTQNFIKSFSISKGWPFLHLLWDWPHNHLISNSYTKLNEPLFEIVPLATVAVLLDGFSCSSHPGAAMMQQTFPPFRDETYKVHLSSCCDPHKRQLIFIPVMWEIDWRRLMTCFDLQFKK